MECTTPSLDPTLSLFISVPRMRKTEHMGSNLEKKNSPYKKNSILMIFKRFGLQTEASALLNTMKKNKDSQLRLIITKEKGFHVLCELLLLGKTTENVRGTIIFNWICEIEWMISNLDSIEFLWISQMKTFRRFPDSHI